MELEFNQVSVCSVAKWDIWPGIVQIVGRRDDSGINLKRAFGSFVGMTRDKDVSSLVLTTTPQQEVVQYSDITMSHVPVAIWLSLLIFVEQFLFIGVIGLRCQVQNTIVLLGLRRNQSQFHLLLQHSKRTPRTVLITENGMKSTKVSHSSTVCSTLDRRQCAQCPSPSVGVFAEWAAFAVEDVKGYALLDTGASRSVGGYMMVQYVIDCLSRNTAPPWLESADPAVSFTIWLPLPGTRHERFAVHIVPSEVTPILLGLDMLREFGLVINADSAHCYSTRLRCRIPVTVLPSGHLGPCFDTIWKLRDNGGDENAGERDCCRYECCCPRRSPGIGTAPHRCR